MSLFDDTTLRKLDRLSLVAHRVRTGVIKGERRSKKHGTSIEFADYRDYVPGDDLRRVDWNVYARLDRPFIKLLEEEEDLAVHLLVDASGSMNWGESEENKFRYALRLAAALGYIALATGDRLTIALLHDGGRPAKPISGPGSHARQSGGVGAASAEKVGAASAGKVGAASAEKRTSRPVQFGPHRGRGHVLRLLKFLDRQEAAGQTDLNAALRDYALAARRPGLAFLISDLFSPNGYRAGLTALQGRGYEVGVFHLLSPDELDPPLAGDLRLIDAETGAGQDVTLDGSLRGLYRRRLRAWRDEIRSHCRKRDVHYVPVETNVRWDELVLYQLRRRGLVK